MSAYLIFTKEKTIEQAELDTYNEMVKGTLAGHPIKLLAAYGPYEVLEGEGTEGMVIAEFPTAEAAKAWYDSPEYTAAKEHRFKGAQYRVILVTGV